MDRFGSLTPYWEEAELSNEVTPDPFSEEPLPSGSVRFCKADEKNGELNNSFYDYSEEAGGV